MSNQSAQALGPPPPYGPTPSNSGSLPSPLEAIPDMRATARWTIGAVAAVGALLVGGGPLTAVGRIDDVGDVVAFGIGMLIVIVAIGWAVWQTTEVLTPPLTTIDMLRDKQMRALRKEIDRSPQTYYGQFGRNPEQLAEGLSRHREVAVNLRAALVSESDEGRRTRWAAALTAAETNIALALRLQSHLLVLIHVWQIRSALRRARLHVLIAMVLVTAGALLFLTATVDNPTHVLPAPPR